MNPLKQLYPPIEPFAIGYLKVSDLHSLYYEEVGNPNGIPVVFLHGGPGVGTQEIFRRYFNPEIFHAILFSQRGAEKSLPLGELKQNDTWRIVEDIEKLRKHFKIDSWFIMGGSWGSTLGLTYAIHHSERVKGLVLRGIFLGRQQELNWLYNGGAAHIYPAEWAKYKSMVPVEEQGDLVKAYYERLISNDRSVQLGFAKAWCGWEDDIIRLIPRPPASDNDEDDLIAFARIECHYIFNHLFFSHDNYLLSEANKIKHIPCWIVQGRYDIVCPVVSAFDLKNVLPQAKLHIIADAGHSITEPGIVGSLIEGIEEFARR